MKFNEFMKQARENAELTQDKASKLIGVSLSSVQNWERDTRPEISILPNIAKAYSIPVKRILEVMASELEITEENTEEKEAELPYTYILPKNLDYSTIKELYFTDREQDMFLIFAMNIKFNGNPIPEILRKYSNSLEVSLFIRKLEKLQLFKKERYLFEADRHYDYKGEIVSSSFTLTDIGAYVYNIIQNHNGELFSIYNQDFKTFLKFIELYKISQGILEKFKIVENLVKSESLELEEYHLYKDKYVNGKYQDVWEKRTNTNNSAISKINSEYYEIKEVESQDTKYQTKKKDYMKKLDFYEKHKDLDVGVVHPGEFEERIVKTAYPTEKAIELINRLVN